MGNNKRKTTKTVPKAPKPVEKDLIGFSDPDPSSSSDESLKNVGAKSLSPTARRPPGQPKKARLYDENAMETEETSSSSPDNSLSSLIAPSTAAAAPPPEPSSDTHDTAENSNSPSASSTKNSGNSSSPPAAISSNR